MRNDFVLNLPAGAVSRALAFGEVFAVIECRFWPDCWRHSVPHHRPSRPISPAPKFPGKRTTPKTGIDDLLCAFSASTAPIAIASLFAITTSILLAGQTAVHPSYLLPARYPHYGGVFPQLLGLNTF